MSLRRKLFYAFTLAVVVALLILPSTSWLARLQLLPFTSGGNARLAFLSDSPSPESQDKSVAAAVARSGNDFALQYARAFGAGFSDDDHARALNRMEKLNEMYPANPVVISALLKMMTRDDVKIRRPEENLLSSPDRRSTKPSAKGERSDPAQVAKFIALAEVGEKQEPQNAYFAVMAAWGYFAAEKDTEAVAAWIRAGEKPRWEDHNTEEVQAKWNLQRAINDGSEIGAMSRMASMGGILFPQYAGMRTSARMAAVMAMQAELAGNKEAGFAIRRASRQIGQNMQTHSKSYIGNLVGSGITSDAVSRAGGAESRKNPYSGNKSSERWAKERQARYVDYLRSIGHPEEATAFTAAVTHTDFLKSLFKRANAKTYWGFEGKTFQLFGAWCANFLLIAGVLFSLVFAGIFKLVYKFSPRFQKSEPLQKSAKWGLSVGLLFPLIAGAVVLSTVGLWVEQDQAAMIAFGVGAICLVVP
ncbi:MAG: hypothetical protein H7145_21035, partial [Akkermansiaceae bacterium]|nr:hypothetical protein [Armatimonadota bacterium]